MLHRGNDARNMGHESGLSCTGVVVEREMKMADDEVFPPPAYFQFSLELRATSVA